jgi:hypothetical protein
MELTEQYKNIKKKYKTYIERILVNLMYLCSYISIEAKLKAGTWSRIIIGLNDKNDDGLDDFLND